MQSKIKIDNSSQNNYLISTIFFLIIIELKTNKFSLPSIHAVSEKKCFEKIIFKNVMYLKAKLMLKVINVQLKNVQVYAQVKRLESANQLLTVQPF